MSNNSKIYKKNNIPAPDFEKFFQQDQLDVESLARNPNFFDTFLIPGEENGEKVCRIMQAFLTKDENLLDKNQVELRNMVKSESLSKIEVQKAILKEFRAYPVNSFLVSQNSEQLSMTLSHFDTFETKYGIVPLSFDDPEKLLPQILKFFYKHEIEITQQNAVGILILSQRLLINDILDNAFEYMNSNIAPKTALFFMEKFLLYPEGSSIFLKQSPEESIVSVKTNSILEHLSQFISSNLGFLIFASFDPNPFYSSSSNAIPIPKQPQKVMDQLVQLPFKNFVELLKQTREFTERDYNSTISDLICTFLEKNKCFIPKENETIKWGLTDDEQKELLNMLGMVGTKHIFSLLQNAIFFQNLAEKQDKDQTILSKNEGLVKKLRRHAEIHFSSYFTHDSDGSNANLEFMSEEEFISFISCENLNVFDEIDVYKAIKSYINKKKPKISPENLEKLKKCVRIEQILKKDIKMLFSDQIIPTNDLFSAGFWSNLQIKSIRDSMLKHICIPFPSSMLNNFSELVFSESFRFNQLGNAATNCAFRNLVLDSETINIMQKNKSTFLENAFPFWALSDVTPQIPGINFYFGDYLSRETYIISFPYDEFFEFEGEIFGIFMRFYGEPLSVQVFLNSYPSNTSFSQINPANDMNSPLFSVGNICEFNNDPNLASCLIFNRPFYKQSDNHLMIRISIHMNRNVRGSSITVPNLFSFAKKLEETGKKNSFGAANGKSTSIFRQVSHEDSETHSTSHTPDIKLLTSATRYRTLLGKRNSNFEPLFKDVMSQQ